MSTPRLRRDRHTRGDRADWSGRRDSNPRPQPWQGCALPLSYTRILTGSGSCRPPLLCQNEQRKATGSRSGIALNSWLLSRQPSATRSVPVSQPGSAGFLSRIGVLPWRRNISSTLSQQRRLPKFLAIRGGIFFLFEPLFNGYIESPSDQENSACTLHAACPAFIGLIFISRFGSGRR
jgi:hypothetical protein